jgi:hypothetical protein
LVENVLSIYLVPNHTLMIPSLSWQVDVDVAMLGRTNNKIMA